MKRITYPMITQFVSNGYKKCNGLKGIANGTILRSRGKIYVNVGDHECSNFKLIENYLSKNKHQKIKKSDDGTPIFSARHPAPKLSHWERIKLLFSRQRLSKEAIEPADHLPD